MVPGAPTETEVVHFLEALAAPRPTPGEPLLGTLRLITPDKRRSATASVLEGLVIGCGREISVEAGASDVLAPPRHERLETEPQTSASPLVGTASDAIGVPSHGVTITHVDALAHFHVDGRIHGGVPVPDATAADPPAPGGAHELRDGIVTRAVLLDLAALRGRPWLEAGEAIHPGDLDAAESAAGVRVEPGDALLIRTGWARRRAELGPYPERKHRPGLHASTLPWLHRRQIAVVASDAAHDVVPSGYRRIPMPIHTVGLVAMGLCLIDGCDFERLAAALAERRRATGLFVVAPLAFRNATGSPVNPLVVL